MLCDYVATSTEPWLCIAISVRVECIYIIFESVYDPTCLKVSHAAQFSLSV